MNRMMLAFASLCLFAGPCDAGESENIEIVRSMVKTINGRDLDALDKFVAQDVVRHSAATPDVSVTSLAEFRAFLEADLEAVPDSVQAIDIIFGNDDFVAVRATYSGTQEKPMGPFPASNKKMMLPFMAILRIEDKKIAEIWVEWDNIYVLTQLGHFPPPAE